MKSRYAGIKKQNKMLDKNVKLLRKKSYKNQATINQINKTRNQRLNDINNNTKSKGSKFMKYVAENVIIPATVQGTRNSLSKKIESISDRVLNNNQQNNSQDNNKKKKKNK